jgi:hypothetical protein
MIKRFCNLCFWYELVGLLALLSVLSKEFGLVDNGFFAIDCNLFDIMPEMVLKVLGFREG